MIAPIDPLHAQAIRPKAFASLLYAYPKLEGLETLASLSYTMESQRH